MKVIDRRAALLSDHEVLSLMREMDQHHRSAAHRIADDAQPETAREADEVYGLSNRHDEAEAAAEEKALSSLPPNLRTIQYSVLEQLSSVQRPCAHQEPHHVTSFLAALRKWERGYEIEGLSLSAPPPQDEVANQHASVAAGAEQGQEEFEESYYEDGEKVNGDTAMGEQAEENEPTANGSHRVVPRVIRENRFTRGERLMLVNHAPLTIIELHCLVEEVVTRFTEEQMADVLALVAHFLPLDASAMAADTAETGANDGQTQQAYGQDGYYHQEEGDEAMEDEGNIYDEQLEALENEVPSGDAVGADGADDD